MTDNAPATAIEMIGALEDLLTHARAGRLGGIAAVAVHRDGTYDTVVTHAGPWDPLRVLGGLDRLHRHVHHLADHAGG